LATVTSLPTETEEETRRKRRRTYRMMKRRRNIHEWKTVKFMP